MNTTWPNLGEPEAKELDIYDAALPHAGWG